jgi:hypothetical protein
VKLRARWTGPVPRVGDYLASTTRPRYAYRIRRILRTDPTVRWDPAQKVEVRSLSIEVDRVPIAAVQPLARVHPWRWDKRTSTKTKPLTR